MYILTGYIMLFEIKFKFVMHNCKIVICIFTFKGKCVTKISQNACFLVNGWVFRYGGVRLPLRPFLHFCSVIV